MAATQEVLVRLRAVGQRAFQRDMDTSAESVEGVGKASESTAKKTAKNFGKWAAGSAAVAAGSKALKDSVVNAVDLGEEINKTAVVFRGPGAKALLDWSKGSAKAMGVSRQQALAAAGTFGNMLVPMGFARTRAAQMSKNMVGLAGDMASFNNATPEDTLEALRSGLAGETEPLRKYGVFLNDARLKAQAMSMGLVKASKDTQKIKASQLAADLAQRKYNAAVDKYGAHSTQAKQAMLANQRAQIALGKATKGTIPQLTASQKAQATYALVLKDTKDAQGDFQRTSNSLANRQRVLKAQYADITAQLGQKLLPVLQWLANNLPVVAAAVGVLTTAVIAYKVASIAAAVAGTAMNASILLIPIAIAAVVAGVVILYKKWGWFHDAVNTTFDWIKSHWPLLVSILLGPFGIAVVAIIKNFDKIKRAASSVWGAIKTAFSKIKGFVSHIFTTDFVGGIGRGIADWLNAHTPFGDTINLGFKKIHIPALAAGGTLTTPGSVLVGEQGPEILTLPAASTVTPLPTLAGAGMMTANLYLDRRLVASAVAQRDADVRARR